MSHKAKELTHLIGPLGPPCWIDRTKKTAEEGFVFVVLANGTVGEVDEAALIPIEELEPGQGLGVGLTTKDEFDEEQFKKDIQSVINRHSVDNLCDTPDFILAEFVDNVLGSFAITVKARDLWLGRTTAGEQIVTGKKSK